MSMIEKRKVVNEYCNLTGCKNCVLNNRPWENEYRNDLDGKCLSIFDATEDEIDEAIRLIASKESHDEVIETLELESVGPEDVEIDLSVVEEIMASESIEDPINPSYYTDGKIEVIEFIEDKDLGYCLGNAVKYIARAGKKDPNKEVEDLEKAKWYVERRIKQVQGVV